MELVRLRHEQSASLYGPDWNVHLRATSKFELNRNNPQVVDAGHSVYGIRPLKLLNGREDNIPYVSPSDQTPGRNPNLKEFDRRPLRIVRLQLLEPFLLCIIQIDRDHQGPAPMPEGLKSGIQRFHHLATLSALHAPLAHAQYAALPEQRQPWRLF